MHVFNKVFDKIFLITTDLPNERYSYISNHLNGCGIDYDMRIAPPKDFYNTRYVGEHDINCSEQSLSSEYASLIMESIYKKYKSVVFIEDDTKFSENFNEDFMLFYNNTPPDWDILHLGDYKVESYIKKTNINQYVDKLQLKYTTNCIILKNKDDNLNNIYNKIKSSRYQIDFVLNTFYESDLNCYSPTNQLTEQLSYRDEDPKKMFKSLIR